MDRKVLCRTACLLIALAAASSRAEGPCQVALEGDLNRDCRVDMDDLNRLASLWLEDVSGQAGAYLPPGIFVAPPEWGGYDFAGCGTLAEPCASIQQGIFRAQAVGRNYVFAANGLYAENLIIANGVDLWGGFDPVTWVRQPLFESGTIITGTLSGSHAKTVTAESITQPTTLSGLVIRGADVTASGANSYAVWIRNCNSHLVLEKNQIYAGRGAEGADGADGQDGTNGSDGMNGQPAKDTGYDCFEECKGLGETPGGSGGVLNCNGVNLSGGAGSDALCPDWNEQHNNCKDCSGSADQYLTFAANGSGPSFGKGGQDGMDGYIDQHCTGGCSLFVPPYPMDGEDGLAGGIGSDGSGGSGAGTSQGTVGSSEWKGYGGSAGTDGVQGSGGGGGGAGGGVEHAGPDTCGWGRSDIGGSGGGGGSGGCKGTGGIGGSAGGGSFGIFVVNSVSSSNAPTVVNNMIYAGQGGAGGNGGFGGKGGLGGSGGTGGAGGQPGTMYWGAGSGGEGGAGGSGGAGGGGGGGAGGAAFGIYTWNVTGTLNYHLWNTFNGMFSGGAGGKAGKSTGQDGTAGTAGAAGNHFYH